MYFLPADREQQLDQILGTSIAEFDIPDEVYERAVERYEDVARVLAAYWDDSTSDGLVYPQGSFRLGTVVQPIKEGDDYDIDLVCRRDILKESISQASLKEDVGKGLNGYLSSRSDGAPVRTEGKRCWTLNFPLEPFHMDVLPAIPDTESPPNAILLTDKGLREWQHSNPIDYTAWFHGRMEEELAERRRAVAKRMEIADVPAWKSRTTLQRTVQALKRHRDLFFADRANERPASIIITTLAALAYVGGGPLFEVLVNVTAKMPGFVEQRNGEYWVANPVQPAENFADRWRRHPGSDRRFFEWMEKAHADFSGYGAELGIDTVLRKIASTFGEGSAKRAGQVHGSNMARARDVGVLGMGVSLGSSAIDGQRIVPQHTFHGDAQRPSGA